MLYRVVFVINIIMSDLVVSYRL